MDINLKQKVKIHNYYEAVKYDMNGNVLQKAYAYNVANSSRWACASFTGEPPNTALDSVAGTRSAWNDATIFKQILIGTGTSAAGPNINDNGLFKLKHSFDVSWKKDSRDLVDPNNFCKLHYTASCTLPPTTAYVGDYTEIGLGYYYSYVGSQHLLSHAYFVDAENNPCVISKTSTEILVITAHIYFTPELVTPDARYNFKYFPAYANALMGNYTYEALNAFPRVSGARAYLSPAYMPEAEANILKYPVDSWGIKFEIPTCTWAVNFPITRSITNSRIELTSGNIGFMHSIVFPDYGAIQLPNENILPPYAFNGIVIGTGDGSTTNFKTDVDELALDANGIPRFTAYVNGEATKATFINFDITKSPLYNKVAYLEKYTYKNHNSTARIELTSRAYSSTKYVSYPIAMSSQCFSAGGRFSEYAPAPNSNIGDTDYGTRVIYYDEAGITLDHIIVGKYYSSSLYTAQFYLQYSDDGNTWTTAATVTTAYIPVYFTPVTAKYWRIYSTNTNWNSEFYNRNSMIHTAKQEAYANSASGYDPKYLVAGNSAEYDFGKVGLNFETPPADGAEITMDAILDLPFKNNDIILTFSYSVTLDDPMAE